MGREPGGGVGKIIFEENVCVAWYDIKTCPGVVRERLPSHSPQGQDFRFGC